MSHFRFDKINSWITFITLILFFLINNIITHSGSTLLALIFAVSLATLFSRKKSSLDNLDKYEKIYLSIVLMYLLFHILSLLWNGIYLGQFKPRLSLMDQQLRLILIFPLLLLFNQKKVPFMYFGSAIIGGAILSGFFSINELLRGVSRGSGSYHAIAFGDLAIIMGFLSAFSYSYFKEKSRWMVIFPFIGFASGIVAAVLSASRGAFFALPVFVLALIIYFRKNIFVYAAVLILFISGYSIDRLNNNLLSERFYYAFKNLSLVKSQWENGKFSDQIRFELWRSAVLITKDHPFIGVGQPEFNRYSKMLIEEKKVAPIVGRYTQPHNQQLFDMMACGVIQGIFSVLIFFYPVFIFIKKRRGNPLIAYSGVVLSLSFFAFGLTETILMRNIYTNFFVITLAFMLAGLKGCDDRV